ncbi:MAG: hypothetical protein D6686_01465, partial [Alphaproteobacteria bacterium]
MASGWARGRGGSPPRSPPGGRRWSIPPPSPRRGSGCEGREGGPVTAAAAALVLAAALCHAGWNFLVKRINGGPELLWLFSAISSLLYLPLALWIVIVARPPLGPAQILFMAGSTALHLGYFALLQAGYRRGDLSLVYPVARATGPILSTLFAVAVLGERLSARMALGGGVIVLGILMLTGPRGGA